MRVLYFIFDPFHFFPSEIGGSPSLNGNKESDKNKKSDDPLRTD